MSDRKGSLVGRLMVIAQYRLVRRLVDENQHLQEGDPWQKY